jgi:hypothetical protein
LRAPFFISDERRSYRSAALFITVSHALPIEHFAADFDESAYYNYQRPRRQLLATDYLT